VSDAFGRAATERQGALPVLAAAKDAHAVAMAVVARLEIRLGRYGRALAELRVGGAADPVADAGNYAARPLASMAWRIGASDGSGSRSSWPASLTPKQAEPEVTKAARS
jgi:hypothetical protein